MELSPGAQLVQAMSALFFGGALGAVYDVLRAVRRVLKRRAYAFDALFCLCVLSALFFLGMDAGEGELRIFMALSAALGCALYLSWVSPLVLPLMERALSAALVPARFAAKTLRRGAFFCKKLFQSRAKWFKIKHKSAMGPERENPRRPDETGGDALYGTQNSYGGEAAASRGDRLRRDEPRGAGRRARSRAHCKKRR